MVIGREAPAQVVINDPRISRAHLRLQPDGGSWVAVDNSRNGTYLDGARQASFVVVDGMTITLGESDGIPVTFAFTEPSDENRTVPVGAAAEDHTEWVLEGEIDEGIARAGAAVAARREELGIAQRSLARNKIMNAGALIAFEKGRSWPRKQTLAKLEDVLQWPPGMISRIRYGTASPDEETTEALSSSVGAPLMAQTVELALGTLTTAIQALPDPADAEFRPRVAAVLADLRRLESVAANATRSARGAPELAIALSTVRKRYDELMLRAARSGQATLGQRLYAARRRAELTVDEVASATGVSAELITSAEADGPIAPGIAGNLESFVGMLAGR
ncbi:MAG: FHA domain-containing protein [Mycobacteriaceae bacterium]|nr:FHA domain-containing protein [Mycobacteriaceae bacterium]